MSAYPLIPYPTRLQPARGVFVLDHETSISPDSASLANAESLQGLLRPAIGFPFEIKQQALSNHNTISLTLKENTAHLGSEGYKLTIDTTKISLTAATTTGIFYAIQTLRQLLPAEVESENVIPGLEWKLPCVEIEDSPRYSWRGFMLDEARHFQGISTVKKLLDQMALLKLNRFHWHLTDDQGWRIEIKQYPQLTEVGGKRAGTLVRNPSLSKRHNQIPHLGFYSQHEIREIVAYAAVRHIMVIPEIEVPGHAMAALAACPELSCTGGPFEVPAHWGVFPDIFCAGKPETYTFLETVLSEVIDLFPAPYIHIGGDEAPKRRWKTCPDCQKKIRDNQLESEHDLQVYLTNHLADFVRKSGKRIIFWSDAFDDAIDPDAIVQFWVGNRKKIIQSVIKGRDLINSPYSYAYLDQSYNTIPLQKTIQFSPELATLSAGSEGKVLGFEGLLWGEWLPNFRRVEYQAFPRLIALAESGWQSEIHSQDFIPRLEKFLHRLDFMNIGWAPIDEAQPGLIKRLFGKFAILLPKRGISKPVEEEGVHKNLVEIPLHLSGKLYRSPMPYSRFDFGETTFQEYLQSDISTVVMLVQEGEDYHYIEQDLKKLYRDHHMDVIHFPIADFDTPEDLEELLETLHQVADLCSSGKNVAVHCYAGRGRTGMFIAMLVRLITGMKGEEAINYIRQFFPAIETGAQQQLVRELNFSDEKQDLD
ncbi:MAG: family 20 glycosylhydrolase [Anaerolineales bacterium]|nr:family 20 glycosylhydrolase [Anaerolineales bacterium]